MMKANVNNHKSSVEVLVIHEYLMVPVLNWTSIFPALTYAQNIYQHCASDKRIAYLSVH